MQPRQVVLANEPRLLRGMLQRVIAKAPGLEIAGEVTDLAKLTLVVGQTNAHWVIMSLWPAGQVPSLVESILAERPSVSVLGVAADGSQARIRRAGLPETVLWSPSLDELFATLLSE